MFCYLFFYVAWPYSATFSSATMPQKEIVPAEAFLNVDPLVGVSTALAGRFLGLILLWTGMSFVFNLLVPRGFCSYVCPLGTLIDLSDTCVGRVAGRLSAFRKALPDNQGTGEPDSRNGGWLTYTRYYVLAAVLVSSAFGVLLSGYVSAIPVFTRGVMFVGGDLQLGLLKNWAMVRPPTWEMYFSIALFAGILLLGVFGGRFWCRYICPSGASLSVFGLLRITERKVTSACILCGKCRRECPFGAVREDYSARPLECTFCRTCAGVCPVDAVSFTWRWKRPETLPEAVPPAPEEVKEGDEGSTGKPATTSIKLSRRGFLAAGLFGTALPLAKAAGLPGMTGAKLLRPPGSAAEKDFLRLCIRCGECFKVCPGPVLHPAGLEGGLDSLWTPRAVPTWAGCHQECNFCGQVCPTGAVRPLPLEEKKRTHMGLAVVDAAACLPHAGIQDCRLCYDECEAAGYHAIDMREIELPIGEIPPGMPDILVQEASHILAPFVDRDKCVGCGLCEYRCHHAYVKRDRRLRNSAIVIVPENETRPPASRLLFAPLRSAAPP